MQALQSAKLPVITLLLKELATKRIFTELQDEQPLSRSFTVFSLFVSFLLEEGTIQIPHFQVSSQKGGCRVPSAITYFPSHCSSAAQTMQQLCDKQPLLLDCLCPEPTSYRNASSVGAGTCPVLQLKHHRANKAIRGLGTA